MAKTTKQDAKKKRKKALLESEGASEEETKEAKKSSSDIREIPEDENVELSAIEDLGIGSLLLQKGPVFQRQWRTKNLEEVAKQFEEEETLPVISSTDFASALEVPDSYGENSQTGREESESDVSKNISYEATSKERDTEDSSSKYQPVGANTGDETQVRDNVYDVPSSQRESGESSIQFYTDHQAQSRRERRDASSMWQVGEDVSGMADSRTSYTPRKNTA